jgi:uncharacterized caspase-like protein
MRVLAWFKVGLLALLAAFAGPAAAKRVALVIANSSYANTTPLKNPSADAKLIAAALGQSGFDDVQIKSNLNKTMLESELRRFGIKSEGADVALIYFAGHGIEAGGENYLIPTDAQLLRDRDLDIEATRLNTLLSITEGARMRVIILDACRNNPFMATMQRTMTRRSGGRGLAQIEPEGQILVVYAAKAGSTASDGEGENSPFAEALAKRLPEPGLEISLLFRAVRDDVLAKTGRAQEPFTYGSLSGQAFYFKPGTQVATSSASDETLFWQGAVSANSLAAYQSYLDAYPKGRFAAIATENIKRLKPSWPPKPTTTANKPATRPGYIGVSYAAVENEIADGLGFDRGTGLLIQSVDPKSPAEKAGLRPADVILRAAGLTISAGTPLSALLERTGAHEAQVFDIIRDRRRLSVVIKPIDVPRQVEVDPCRNPPTASQQLSCKSPTLKLARDTYFKQFWTKYTLSSPGVRMKIEGEHRVMLEYIQKCKTEDCILSGFNRLGDVISAF